MNCKIIPDKVLLQLIEQEQDTEAKNYLADDLIVSAQNRAVRTTIMDNKELLQDVLGIRNENKHKKAIHFYDCGNTWNLPDSPTKIDEEKHSRGKGHSHDHSHSISIREQLIHATYDFFHNVFKRESFNNYNGVVNFYINYGKNYNNAFWDGENMVFGNGNPHYFRPFGDFIDIVAHEFGHAVTQYESDLVYYSQSGALNEHASDVFGTIIKQYYNKQTVDQADWLIGGGLWNTETMGAEYRALRDMKNPGTAYPGDDQPAHINEYYTGEEDHQGVHINSGIPNKAFYNAVMNLGDKYSWQKAGIIWYRSLGDQRFTQANSNFVDFANTTVRWAWRHYGDSARIAVRTAWMDVGIPTTY